MTFENYLFTKYGVTEQEFAKKFPQLELEEIRLYWEAYYFEEPEELPWDTWQDYLEYMSQH